MISPEQLIADLLKQVSKLEEELTQAQQDIRDFEKMAIEWKKGYVDLERKHRIEVTNMKQVIDSMQAEIDATYPSP
jgi:virulence-associated protein VapD